MTMYFLVGNAIVDRDDLTLYEKMACVVLARYTGQDAFHDLLTLEVIARKMSTGTEQARLALEGLVTKGLIQKESAERIAQEPSQPAAAEPSAKPSAKPQAAPVVFESFDPPKREVTSDEVVSLFEEVITKRQALILFELAGRDLEALKSAYQVVKASRPFDLVEALSDYLQQKPQDKGAAQAGPGLDDHLGDAGEVDKLFEALERPKGQSQVNLSRIHALYKQQKQKS